MSEMGKMSLGWRFGSTVFDMESERLKEMEEEEEEGGRKRRRMKRRKRRRTMMMTTFRSGCRPSRTQLRKSCLVRFPAALIREKD